MKKTFAILLAMLMLLTLFGCKQKDASINQNSVYYADIEIENYGTITVKLD